MRADEEVLKLCVNCKFCTYTGRKWRWWDGPVPISRYTSPLLAECAHPRVLSLVDGSPIVRCAVLRAPSGLCGLKGTLYEPREEE